MRTLAIIPARGGSKGIPGKNIAMLAGKPLIAWTIEAALASPGLARVIVSTDDPQIAAVARQFGAEVPFLRPAELARDESASIDAVEHTIGWLAENEGERPDYLMLLQPTSPLRTAADIDGALALAGERQAEAIISVCVASPHPYLARAISGEGYLESYLPIPEKPKRRQDYPPAYMINGAIYLNRRDSLLATRSFQPPSTLPFLMPAERSLDIDAAWDLHLAELLLRDARVERSPVR